MIVYHDGQLEPTNFFLFFFFLFMAIPMAYGSSWARG